jgi:hypothetical protein
MSHDRSNLTLSQIRVVKRVKVIETILDVSVAWNGGYPSERCQKKGAKHENKDRNFPQDICCTPLTAANNYVTQ